MAMDESTDTNPGTGRRVGGSTDMQQAAVVTAADRPRPGPDPKDDRPELGPDPIGWVPTVADGPGTPGVVPEVDAASVNGALIDLVPGADQIPEPEVLRPTAVVSVIERMPDSINRDGDPDDE